MPLNPDFKPCPFCGGLLGTGDDSQGHDADCYIVLMLARCNDIAKLTAAWNRRTPEVTVPPIVSGDALERAGYRVHSKMSHVGTAWDFTFPGKTGMDNRHYRSEKAAHDAAVLHFNEAVLRARALLAAAGDSDAA